MLLISRIGAILFLLFSASAALTADDIPQTTHDGLELVENSDLGILYVHPDAVLTPYKRIALLDSTMEFRKNWRRDLNRKALGVSDRVTKNDEIELQEELSTNFMTIFVEEWVDNRGFELSEFTAEDVLVLEPSVVNIDIIRVNEDSAIGLFNYAAYTGQMTLLLEVYDSVTGSILVRIIDKQVVVSDGAYRVGNKETNNAESLIVFRKWAAMVGDYLAKSADMGDES